MIAARLLAIPNLVLFVVWASSRVEQARGFDFYGGRRPSPSITQTDFEFVRDHGSLPAMFLPDPCHSGHESMQCGLVEAGLCRCRHDWGNKGYPFNRPDRRAKGCISRQRSTSAWPMMNRRQMAQETSARCGCPNHVLARYCNRQVECKDISQTSYTHPVRPDACASGVGWACAKLEPCVSSVLQQKNGDF
jgi:hypothetical protein